MLLDSSIQSAESGRLILWASLKQLSGVKAPRNALVFMSIHTAGSVQTNEDVEVVVGVGVDVDVDVDADADVDAGVFKGVPVVRARTFVLMGTLVHTGRPVLTGMLVLSDMVTLVLSGDEKKPAIGKALSGLTVWTVKSDWSDWSGRVG